MIDPEAGGGLYPQAVVKCLLDIDDITVGERRPILRVTLEAFEGIAVITVKSGGSAKPDVSFGILDDTVHLTAGESVFGIQRLEKVDSGCHHRHQQHQKQYQ